LLQRFSIEKVHKGGARFDYEKARWFNHEWIKKLDASHYEQIVKETFAGKGLHITDDVYFSKVLNLVKDRCTLLGDFWEHSFFFFKAPLEYNTAPFRMKWNDDKRSFFKIFSHSLASISHCDAATIEANFKQLATQANIK